MLLAPRLPFYIPSHRLGGLAASAALHFGVILAAGWPVDVSSDGVTHASGETRAAPSRAIPVERVTRLRETPQASASRPALELAGIEVELDKLTGGPAELFPFVPLDPLTLGPAASDASASRRLVNPLLAGARPSSRPPLALSAGALQSLVDQAWSRRERWRPFQPIAELIAAHDGDTGHAADLLRAYTDQNLLQPYYDGDTVDARYWTMLGLAADHRTFLRSIEGYLREQPGTKAATELLFLLDELVQGSTDSLLLVVANAPATSLRRTAAEQPDAYQRSEQLYAQTRDWLSELGLDTPDAIRRRLESVRLGLLAQIVERSPGGYRVADAHYLAGEIHFERRDRARAFAAWRRAVPSDESLYRTVIGEIHAALALPPERQIPAIVAALGAEHGRWLAFSERRLERFGYRAEQF